jgi:hypothetical protein
MRPYSFFQRVPNPDFCRVIQGVTGVLESARFAMRTIPRVYSAAAAKAGFKLAADSMKSEMRGTISDLKREPLNTP